MDRERAIDLALVAAWVFMILVVATLFVVAIVMGSKMVGAVTVVMGIAWALILTIITNYLKDIDWSDW